MNAVYELRVGHGAAEPSPRRRRWLPARSQSRGKPIVLFGLFGCGNLGNDASLESLLSFLRNRRPETPVSCVCKDTSVISEVFGLKTFPIRRGAPIWGGPWFLRRLMKIPAVAVDFIRALRIMRSAGLLVVPGTGILDDFGDRPTGMPFDIFKWCLAARIAGARIAFVSIGAGPIGNRLSRWFMTGAVGMADYRSYRDIGSSKFVESLGIDTGHDPLYPDLAFRLSASSPDNSGSTGPLTVGVGIMRYRGWYGFKESGQAVFDTYAAKMVKFIRFLLESGCRVRLLTGDKDDDPAVKAVLSALGPADATRLSWEPVRSIHDVISQVARSDLVVATRFHNVVAALLAGKPVISLSYADKNDLLLGQMGLGDYCQHIDSFEVDGLCERFERLAKNREEHAGIVAAKVAEFRRSLETQDEYLLATLI